MPRLRSLLAVLIPSVLAGQTLPRVVIQTTLGQIEVEIDTVHAPVSAQNFLRYVDAKFFDRGSFHRTVTMTNQPNDAVKIEVIQAGGNTTLQKQSGPILLERTTVTGLKHRAGTISMARTGPDTARDQFFICVTDQPELDFGGKRNPDGQGFAAFGKVVAGLDIVRKIQQSPADGQRLTPAIAITQIKRNSMLFQAPPPPTAFVDVAVLAMDQPGVLEHQTVLVKDGRVFWIGPAEQAPSSTNYRVIDGRGQFLLPGFSDMHTHPGRPLDLVTYLANGITTIRVMWGDTATLGWRKAVAAGSLAGPRIVTSGAIIDGSPPSQPSMTVVTDPAKTRAEIAAQHRAGYDFIKVYNSVPKAVYDTIVRVARGLGMPVAGHVPFEVGLTGALAAKQASIEHLRGYIAELVPKDAAVRPGATLRSRTVAWNYIDRSRFPGLVEQTVRAGVWNTPTFVVAYHMMLPDSAYRALAQRPEVKLFPGQGAPDRSKISFLADFTEADFAEAGRALVPQLELARALANGGAKLMIGTDSWLQGYAYHDELMLFERGGFSPAEVLRLAARAGPEFLGNALTQGTVAPGQVADLQLVGGNPLESLGNLRDRRGVMAQGRWYSAADLNARLTGGAP